jgi:hypothetical protein
VGTKGLEAAADKAKGSLPPKQQKQVEKDAKDSAKEADAAVEGMPEWLLPVAGTVGGAAILYLLLA